jgi:hypothetical protein
VFMVVYPWQLIRMTLLTTALNTTLVIRIWYISICHLSLAFVLTETDNVIACAKF